MKKLWQKNWELDSFIESFETKGDLLLDQKLVAYDVYGSLAHAKMLCKIGILSENEAKSLVSGLVLILKLTKNNKFVLQMGDEDMHSKIETFLVEKYGNVGKKIHTGRSRNDQVATVIRLFTRDSILLIWIDLLTLIESFHSFAQKYEFIPMPGYTHTQKAMPSSIGMWAGAFTESFLDDLIGLKSAYKLNNKSPLGSAAGYGVPLTLDRDFAAKLLGFNKLQVNSLYAQNSRGKIEAMVIAAINSILLGINKFATDVVLFTSSEFGYFKVSEKLLSGSTIMPQKKNVDCAELLRSKVHTTLGNYSQVVSLSSNLMSGYNRDLQDIKKPLMESLETAHDCIKVANVLINNIEPQKIKLEEALTPEIFSTHKSIELVKIGVPFRTAYQKIGANTTNLNVNETNSYLKQSTHIGGTGNLGLNTYLAQMKNEKEIYIEEINGFQKAINNLTKNYEK